MLGAIMHVTACYKDGSSAQHPVRGEREFEEEYCHTPSRFAMQQRSAERVGIRER